jgi:citrate lyase subunit beta/citryl-CoA lyase
MTAPRLPGPALLFCPADRPDRYAKAAAAADMVILDLEDAVAPANRADARGQLIEQPLDPDRTMVRINAVGTIDHIADLAALSQTQYRWVMLAKAETGGQFVDLVDYNVVALCETAAGVVNVAELARIGSVRALMWGAEDLMASLGGGNSRDEHGQYLDVARQARASVLLHARAANLDAIDAVFINTTDLDALAGEAAIAVQSGFQAKACIHPRQVDVVRTSFRPTEQQRRWAERVIGARGSGGVFVVDGQMIDMPLLRQAEAILLRARPR